MLSNNLDGLELPLFLLHDVLVILAEASKCVDLRGGENLLDLLGIEDFLRISEVYKKAFCPMDRVFVY